MVTAAQSVIRSKGHKLFWSILIGVVAVFVLIWEIEYFFLTGSLWPISKIDKLNFPIQVASFDSRGLKLADGRTVMPAGMIELPKDSQSLKILTSNGVEVSPDQKVYGLVQIAHTCGNDAVKFELRRMDIAQILAYYREGKTSLVTNIYADTSFTQDGGGSKHGWNRASQIKMAFDPKFAELRSELNRP